MCGNFFRSDPMAYRVSKDQFASLVEEALQELPEQFAEFLEEVPVEILDRPTAKLVGDDKNFDEVLGVYCGPPLTLRSFEDSGRLPSRIYIFQQPIEAASSSKADLIRQVRITVLHEIGHHFGMDEDDLDELGYG